MASEDFDITNELNEGIVIIEDSPAVKERIKSIYDSIVVHSPDADNVLCPYCGSVRTKDNWHVCEGCEIGHHIECWQQNGGCTTLGCSYGPQQ